MAQRWKISRVNACWSGVGGRNSANWELGYLDKEEARELYDQVEELRHIENSNECWHHSKLLTEIFGDEWHYPLQEHAVEENHEFTCLRRIVEALQEALRQDQQAAA